MDIRQLNPFPPTSKTPEVRAHSIASGQTPITKSEQLVEGPSEVFSFSGTSDTLAKVDLPQVASPPFTESPATPEPKGPVSWLTGGVTYSGTSNGPICSIQDAVATQNLQVGQGLTLAEMLQNITAETKLPVTQAMGQRESGYLQAFPYRDDEAAIKSREALNVRYSDPTTSAQSMTQTLTRYAADRGIEIDKAPQNLVGDLSADNLVQVKNATQALVDKLFLSQQTSFNPEKHATVSKETERFLELANQAAPEGFTAADAYKLVAGNLALISYQDKAAAENLLGDHGVRHLLGHNIVACESLADGLEQRGVPVSAMDRLVMHQAMIVHDLGYAMDTVRNPINSVGLKGQDAGHNVLAARYLRERSQDRDDPIAKLFGQGDLDRMHRCVLFHDKDAKGGPGVHFEMKSQLTEEERALNLETMTRVADNSHAFEDKLPELLYRKPQSLKAMRMMKTAGELEDDALVETLKGELAQMISSDAGLARDDKEALLQSVSSVTANSYMFSVGRIAGSKPSFDVGADGKVQLSVVESDVHQQTSALFGMESHRQMEKFVKDCAGERVTLTGGNEVIEGRDVCIIVRGPTVAPSDEFNTELQQGLLEDKAFVKFALLDSQLSTHQSIIRCRQELGDSGLDQALEEIKAKRRSVLEDYRASLS